MSTAKYIAHYNNTVVNIDETFNERIHGVDSYKELPDNFEFLQFNDENYKLENGESQKEVSIRIQKGINRLLKEYQGKRIVVITHATAIMYCLSRMQLLLCIVYHFIVKILI